jgi:hypothetical protein
LERIGKVQEPIDGKARAAALVMLDCAGRDADPFGEPRLGKTTRLAEFGQADAVAGIDGALGLHERTLQAI